MRGLPRADVNFDDLAVVDGAELRPRWRDFSTRRIRMVFWF